MRRILIGLLFVLALAPATVRAQEAPVIAAAADLKFALEEVARRFEAETGRKVRLTFGSSGAFTTQIEQGAPFEMFLSADQAYVFRLADKGLTRDRGVLYARGRIVVFAPHGSPLQVDSQLRGLRQALAQGRIRRFAIANPEHAPYGRAAQQTLARARLWSQAQPRLVRGENAAQAAQFASAGSAQGGIIPYSLSLAPEVARRGKSAVIPADWHDPLDQRMVLTRKAGDTAQRFYAYMQTKPARDILARHGFTLPPGGR
ncbi:MAG: molybdate ABC transporter substrate-binding protein [Phenylobacterium sp.]|uniref:molybdate ABC transporter substrate-binding protein n=1 Tax=Phenylobacterium sp. TaxID=1871053 RepID=UPI003919BC7D